MVEAPTVPTAAPRGPAFSPPAATLGLPTQQRRSRPPIPQSHAPKVTVVGDASAPPPPSVPSTAGEQSAAGMAAVSRGGVVSTSEYGRRRLADDARRAREAAAAKALRVAADAAAEAEAINAAIAHSAAETERIEPPIAGGVAPLSRRDRRCSKGAHRAREAAVATSAQSGAPGLGDRVEVCGRNVPTKYNGLVGRIVGYNQGCWSLTLDDTPQARTLQFFPDDQRTLLAGTKQVRHFSLL